MKQIILLVTMAACETPVPDAPTYAEDVAPILEANCVRCHGAPSTNTEARNCVRLDRWESTTDTTMSCSDTATSGMIFGAHDGGPMLVDQVVTGLMPIDGPALTSRQIEIL